MTVEFELIPVSKNAVAVPEDVLGCNTAAFIFDNFIAVIDGTEWPENSLAFRTRLEGTYDRPVRYIGLTHYHGDHIFGLKTYKDVNMFAAFPFPENVERRLKTDWSPQAFEKMKEENPEDKERIDTLEIIVPPLLFHERLDIGHKGKRLEFHHVGGHTNCSMYAYDPEEKTLFSGDLIFAGMVPYAADVTCDPERWMAVLRSLLEMDIERVVPGHGPLTDRSEIEKHLELFEGLKVAALEVLKVGKGAEDIVIPEVYPNPPKELDWLAERARQKWYEFYGKRRK